MTNLASKQTAIAEGAVLPSELRVGDRVERLQYLDDGTWERLGDDCLQDSPVMKGVVTVKGFGAKEESDSPGIYVRPRVYTVDWDGFGPSRKYFGFGLTKITEGDE